ncbi:N-acetyltransferase family protein [Paraburkholderia sp.]|uniref:GNAT family N-acetyltransferase n=1 Tax=Paraburkholderia sp. TaxID=1926495 RepID=UPI003C75B4AA
MNVDIREASVDDAEAIATVHVSSWQAAYEGIIPEAFLKDLSVAARAKSWRAALEAGKLRVLLASVDGALVGWIAFGACRDADKDNEWGEVEALYLSPGFWERGIGRILSDAACQRLHQAGYTQVALWVLAENRRAIAFYERIGFVSDQASKDIVIGGAPLTEVRFCRGLTEQLATQRTNQEAEKCEYR